MTKLEVGNGGGGRGVDVYIFFLLNGCQIDAANGLGLINVIRGGGNFHVWCCVFILFPA